MKSDFEKFGLTEKEVIIYFSLLKNGRSTIAECVKSTSIGRTSAYQVMRKLVDKGLVAEEKGKVLKYFAISPDLALEEYFQKKQKEILGELSSDIAELRNELFEKERYLFDGLKKDYDNFVNAFIKDAVSLHQKADEEVETDREIVVLKGIKSLVNAMLTIDCKKSFKIMTTVPVLREYNEEREKRTLETIKQSGITYEHLLEEDSLKHSVVRKLTRNYLEYGFPVKTVPRIPSKVMLYDDNHAFILIDKKEDPANAIILRIFSKSLIEHLHNSWHYLWNSGKDLTLEDLRKIHDETKD